MNKQTTLSSNIDVAEIIISELMHPNCIEKMTLDQQHTLRTLMEYAWQAGFHKGFAAGHKLNKD